MNDGPNMLRYDVMNHTFSTVYNVESTPRERPGNLADALERRRPRALRDRARQLDIRDARLHRLRRSAHQTTYVAAKGDYDECQIDKSGRYLVIKENVDGMNGEDNRIIDLQTGVGDDLPRRGRRGRPLRPRIRLHGRGRQLLQGARRRPRLAARAGHEGPRARARSSTSSRRGTRGSGTSRTATRSPVTPRADGVRQQRDPQEPAARQRDRLLPARRIDEHPRRRAEHDDLNASGGGSDDYWKIPKGNIDVTGEYFIWAANMGGNRQDAFIVRIPQDKLGVSPGAPAPTPDPPTDARADADANAPPTRRQRPAPGHAARPDGASADDRQRAVDEPGERDRRTATRFRRPAAAAAAPTRAPSPNSRSAAAARCSSRPTTPARCVSSD